VLTAAVRNTTGNSLDPTNLANQWTDTMNIENTEGQNKADHPTHSGASQTPRGNDVDIVSLSEAARRIEEIADRQARARRYCYPNWREVEDESGLGREAFLCAFDELCKAGVVFSGFPSLLVALADKWPVTSMFGPASARPSPEVWKRIRARIFERDNYTCAYCDARGVRLECDHIIPVSAGGSHDDDNLITSCKPCNQAKRDKVVSVDEWRSKRRAA
jgi:hypothetical protein